MLITEKIFKFGVFMNLSNLQGMGAHLFLSMISLEASIELYNGIATRSISKTAAGLAFLGGGIASTFLLESIPEILKPLFPQSKLSSTTINICRCAGVVGAIVFPIFRFRAPIIPFGAPGIALP